MAIQTYALGRRGKAYYDTAGTAIVVTTTPTAAYDTWLALGTNQVAGNMTDVRLGMGAEFADGTTRETAEGGFGSQVPVLNNGQVTFDMRWAPGDGTTTNFAYRVLQAWQNFSTISMAFFDLPKDFNPGTGNTINVQGLIGNFAVSLEKNEALRDLQRASVTLSATDLAGWHTLTINGT